MSRICEEFGCLPSAALAELLDEPRGMALDIIQLRAYARAKAALDNAKSAEDIPDDPMIEQVFRVQLELIRRREER